MPTNAQLESALINAHKAGDTKAAKTLANAIKQQQPHEFSASRMAENIVPSGKKYIGDMANAFMHPVDSAKALGQVALGAAQLAIPGEQGSEPMAMAVARAIVGRYGSIDSLKRTLETDPVGVAADISSALMGGGALTSRMPGIAGKAGQTVLEAGAALDPLNLASSTVKQAGRLVPRALNARMYDASAKWSTVADRKGGTGTRDRLTATALDEGIAPNARGVLRLEDRISDLSDQLGRKIDEAAAAGATVPIDDLRKALDDVEADIGFEMGRDKSFADINARRSELDDLESAFGANIPAKDLQHFKVELGADINWDKSAQAATKTGTKADKGMRSAAREALEGAVPGVDEINAQLARLYELQEPLKQAASRRENNNLLGMSEMLGAGFGSSAGAVLGDVGVGAATGLALAGVKRKSAEIATYLEKLKRQGIPNSYLVKNVYPALLREAAAQLGKLERVEPAADGEVKK